MEGFSGSTVNPVPVQRVDPASVMEPVQTGRTGPGSVSVTEASTGQAVRPATAGNMESTVTRVNITQRHNGRIT